MKTISRVHWIVLTLLCTLLAAGCAKKPTPEPVVSTSPAPVEEPAPAEPSPVVKPEPVKPQPVMPAPVAELVRINFAFDQSTLSPEARDILAANAAALQANPELKIRIEGHCDERGSDEYNLALGERRAQAAKDFLLSLGVAPERLETISYGEESPLKAGSDQEAWAMNRRAEFQAIR